MTTFCSGDAQCQNLFVIDILTLLIYGSDIEGNRKWLPSITDKYLWMNYIISIKK